MNPSNPTPYSALAADGTKLQAYAWQPGGATRASLVIVHGLRDHASRYGALASALAAQGIAVYAQDHRGHGRSGGNRQAFDSIAQLVGDVHLAVQEAQRRNPGQPVFLYGHSLGGLVATHYSLEHPGALRGLVLTGPALKLDPSVNGVQQSLVRFLGAILPNLPAQPIDDTQFVREASARAELAADPLIVHANLPARSAVAGLDGIEAIQKRMGEVSVPLLILHGTADKGTNIQGSRELHARAASADKTFKPLEGVYHDVMHEPERDAIIADVVGWVTARI